MLLRYITFSSIHICCMEYLVGEVQLKPPCTPFKYFKTKLCYSSTKLLWKIMLRIMPYIKSIKFLKLMTYNKLELGKFMYLYHVNDLPEIFETYFLSIDHAHHYNTRSNSNGNYFVNCVRTNSGKNLIKFLGARLWNQIESQQKSYSYYRFKKEYTKLLLGCYN